MLRATLPFLVLGSMLVAADDRWVSPAEQQEEARWLASLGVKPPAVAWPLADPFAEPFTRRSLVVPTAWYNEFFQNQPRTLRADQFREDIKLLHRIMATAYGGWDSAKHLGWNWDAFFTDWDGALAARGSETIPLADAFAPWRKLMEVQLDNHSGPLAGEAAVGHGYSWSAVLTRKPSAPCTEFRNAKGALYPIAPVDPAQQPKTRQDSGGKPVSYIVTTMAKGPVAAVHCGDMWIPAEAAWMPNRNERMANIRALAQTAKDIPVFRSISPRIGYIRFPSFSKPDVDLTVKLEETLRGRKHTEDLVIVDLRNNGGGDNRIQALLNWTKVPSVEFKRRMGQSCLYYALRWGYTQVSAGGLKPPVSSFRRFSLQRSLDDLFHDDAAGCPAKFVEHAGTWNYAQHRYPANPAGKTRVLALVDNGCGSDCEYATKIISAIPGSVIAGVNTAGVGQFVQPGYFTLPKTRLAFRVALGTSDNYGDGRSFDGYGLDVDIVLATREDQSPENIVALAERLLAAR